MLQNSVMVRHMKLKLLKLQLMCSISNVRSFL